MKKILLLSLLSILLFKPCHAQRLSLIELIDLYELTLPSKYSVQKLNNAVRSSASNWSTVQSRRKATEERLSWVYNFDGSARGMLDIIKDDEPTLPTRLYFRFPYEVQYAEYLKDLKAHAQLVNVSTEKGKQTQFFEFRNLAFALSTYPAELKRYYAEGRPAPFYEIYIQLNRH